MANENITIPQGDSKEDIKAREKIIFEFYHSWKIANPSLRKFNICLGEDINIRSVSIIETAEHAAKKYLSTLAVLQLDAILRCAIRIKEENTKPRTKNQRPFEKMIIMEHECPGIGTVKLTVAVRRSDRMKIQYCITAVDV